MNLFDERVEMILNIKKKLRSSIDELSASSYPASVENENKEMSAIVDDIENIGEIIVINKVDENEFKPTQEDAHKDENSNPAESELESAALHKNVAQISNLFTENNQNSIDKKKALRPTVLNIKSKTSIHEGKSKETASLIEPQTIISKNTSFVNPSSKISDFIQPNTEFLNTISEAESTKSKFLKDRQATLTEAQRNKMRVMQHEYGLITPNNNEATINFPVEENCNANFIPSLTDLQINRLRNMQHQAGNWNPLEIFKESEILVENMTEAQKNKLRNTIHRTEQGSFGMPKKTVTLTEQETHVIREVRESNVEIQSVGFQTPMSCATDYFTSSINSSSIQMQSYENTPFSEFSTDIQVPTTFDETVDASQLILESNLTHLQNKIEYPDFVGFNTNTTTPSYESSLTVIDVEMLDTTSLAVYLEKSVMVPLRIQCRLVNNAIIKYLLQEHNIISHIHSLRDYFFLLNGEFAKSLSHSLFTRLYEVSTPFELFNSATLKSILDRAIVSSLSNSYQNSELLSLSAIGLPTHLQV